MVNAQIPSGGSFSSAGVISSLRFWLIRLLSGKSVIILNARIEKIEEDVVRFKGIEGLCANGCVFQSGLLITQESKNQKEYQ